MIKLIKLLELNINPPYLRWNNLIQKLRDYWIIDSEFFNDMGMFHIDDINKNYPNEYVISELVALNLYEDIEKFYQRNKKVIMDGIDYTDYYLKAKEMYERE